MKTAFLVIEVHAFHKEKLILTADYRKRIIMKELCPLVSQVTEIKIRIFLWLKKRLSSIQASPFLISFQMEPTPLFPQKGQTETGFIIWNRTAPPHFINFRRPPG